MGMFKTYRSKQQAKIVSITKTMKIPRGDKSTKSALFGQQKTTLIYDI